MELVIYDAFREAGVEEIKAKAIAASLNANFKTAINEAIEQRVDVKQLATKADLKIEVEKVRAEIARVEANIVKWIFGSIVTAAGLATGIALAIVRLFFTAS